MTPAHVIRGGLFYRVCDPGWKNPADTSFAKSRGGRWNPPGEFGALYLNATIAVAAANARRALRREFGTAATFNDLRPAQRPQLQLFTVARRSFVNGISDAGLLALGLPTVYPDDVSRARCQSIARALYSAGESGVASRSAVTTGEELAVFDSAKGVARRRRDGRLAFNEWYPGLTP